MSAASSHPISRRAAIFFLAIVILAWGFNWVVTKLLLESATPLWLVCIRSGIALVALFPLMLFRGELVVPKRADVPVILSIGVLHMTVFAALSGIGLSLIPAGRSIVLGYTTPLWVAPGAVLFLNERLSKQSAAGVVIGLAGLALMFNPLAFDWNDKLAVLGNALILLAALCWAASILHVRSHKWVSTPFQLVFWEILLATVLLAVVAYAIEGAPEIRMHASTVPLFLYAGVIGVALAYWAMAMVNRSLPAVTTSIGVLATPVIGVLFAAMVLGESIDLPLIFAMLLIIAGVALGTIQRRK